MVMRAQTSTTTSTRERPRRRFWLIFVAVLLFVLAAAWVVYWYVAYRFTSSYVREASAVEDTDETVLACGDRQLGGFPLQITISCREAVTQSGGARASVAALTATAPLYNPGRVDAEIDPPFNYSGVNHTIGADWTGAGLQLNAGLGGLNRAQVSLAGLDVQVTDLVDNVIWAATADAWGTELRPADGDDTAFRVNLSTSNLVIQLGGNTYPSVSGTAALTILDSGNRVDRDPAAIVGDWLAAGGAFRIDDMVLTSGDVVAEFIGPMTLEIDGTLSGEVTLRYYGTQLPTLVSAIFPWLADDADLVAEALEALSRPIEMRGQPAHEARLVVDHGAVKVGLIPIPLTIPSIGPLDHLLPQG
jgi:hypothetical protein